MIILLVEFVIILTIVNIKPKKTHEKLLFTHVAMHSRTRMGRKLTMARPAPSLYVLSFYWEHKY